MDKLVLYLVAVDSGYNALERREASKGGKELTKRSAASRHSSNVTTGSTAAPKHTTNSSRRSDASHSNITSQSVKFARPSSSGGPSMCSKEHAAFEKQITELKL